MSSKTDGARPMKNVLNTKAVAVAGAWAVLGIAFLGVAVWALGLAIDNRTALREVGRSLIEVVTLGRNFWAATGIAVIGCGVLIWGYLIDRMVLERTETSDAELRARWNRKLKVSSIVGIALWVAGALLMVQTFDKFEQLSTTQIITLLVFGLPLGFMVAVGVLNAMLKIERGDEVQ